jgi:RNA recognition motif-containing protein
LRDTFGSSGTIEKAIIPKTAEGKQRGFAFITFATEEEAQNAISQFDGKEFNGRDIRVQPAGQKA